MLKNYRLFLLLIIFMVNISFVFSQQNDSIFMDYNNQEITDIIYSLASICEESVIIDETVEGIASFHFEDSNFESALKRFCDSCHLYVEKIDKFYYISKIYLKVLDSDLITVNTENIDVELFLNTLSRKTQKTIMYDSLPNAKVTIRVNNVEIEDVLHLVLVKLPGFGLERISSGFYLSKTAGSINSRRNLDIFTISNVEDKYDIEIESSSIESVLQALFKKANKEYSLFIDDRKQINKFYAKNKDFNTILKLILDQVACDYSIDNTGMYYIFDIQQRDVTKNFKTTDIIQLVNMNVASLMAIMPQELNSSSFIRVDNNTNSIILTGSKTEITPILDFIKKVDVPIANRKYERFEFTNLNAKDGISLIPKSLLYSEVLLIPNTNTFVTQVTEESHSKLKQFIEIIDEKGSSHFIKLKYIKSDDLLKTLPPSVKKDDIFVTLDPSKIFFSGSEQAFSDFQKELNKIDAPQQQIKYQILVIQRQKTKGINWSSMFKEETTEANESISHSGMLSNIFNINFDIISQFGIQFATSLNAELSEGKSKVLADTTLNGISGENITFSNTNTYRYRDIIADKNGDVYTSTTREIASGLTLSINGWVSGDDMITVKIDAQVSKQGVAQSSSDKNTTNPPTTSEKKVNTNIRTRSGEPIIIGGLIQQETDIVEKRVPFLGAIPLIGNLFKTKNTAVADTEFVIYLIPFVEKPELEIMNPENNIERYYKKYILEGEKL